MQSLSKKARLKTLGTKANLDGKNLLEKNDSSTIWKAINWNGIISEKDSIQPEDGQFKIHFENLLNPNSNDASESDFEDSPHIPVLDNPFSLP